MRTPTISRGVRWTSCAARRGLPLICLAGTAHAQITPYFDHALFAAAAGPIVRTIGFDDRAAGDGAIIGNEYTPLGLTLIQRSGWPMNLVTAADIAAGSGATGTGSINSPPNALSSSFMHLAYDPNRDDQYDFILACPTNAAGLYLGNVGPGQTIVQFRAADNTVLDAQVIDSSHAGLIPGPSANDNRIFYGITSAGTAIGNIRITRVLSNPDGVVFDDIQWTIQPATIAQQPQSATACYGGSAVFTAAGGGGGAFIYQWQFQDGGLWLNIPEGGDITLGAGTSSAEFFGHSQGSTHGVLTVSGVVSPRNHPSGLPLRCIISDSCTGATTDTATLTACYANCDCSTQSPTLNVLDFGCYLNKFAAGDPYANCDGSTQPPVLNVLDFGCFLNKFAAGCP